MVNEKLDLKATNGSVKFDISFTQKTGFVREPEYYEQSALSLYVEFNSCNWIYNIVFNVKMVISQVNVIKIAFL